MDSGAESRGAPRLPDAALVLELHTQPVVAEPDAELVHELLVKMLRRVFVMRRVEQLKHLPRRILLARLPGRLPREEFLELHLPSPLHRRCQPHDSHFPGFGSHYGTGHKACYRHHMIFDLETIMVSCYVEP